MYSGRYTMPSFTRMSLTHRTWGKDRRNASIHDFRINEWDLLHGFRLMKWVKIHGFRLYKSSDLSRRRSNTRRIQPVRTSSNKCVS